MTVIRYTEPKRYQFASILLRFCESLGSRITSNPTTHEINVEDELLAQLLERINDGHKAVVVPHLKTSRWLVTAPDRRQLEQARLRIQHFLVPTYATFEENGRSFKFDDTKPFQKLGSELYPAGYYVLQSRKDFENQILTSLRLWLDLEKRSPQFERDEEVPTYNRLYSRFKMSLATAQWSEAEQVRHMMLLLNLTSAENLLFLEIEQFATQKRWKEIWLRRDTPQMVQARVPRPVRGALLTAFHQTILLPLEQKGEWKNALETFRENTPALGTLLTGRLGLTEGPIVQIFAYQAALEQDRAMLLELMNINSSPAVQLCIQQLLPLVVSRTSPASDNQEIAKHTSLSLAREALDYGNFDVARQYSEEVEEKDIKIVLLMQIAYHTVDVSLAEDALSLQRTLSDDEQHNLLQRFPFINHIHKALQKFIVDAESQSTDKAESQATPQNWLTWLDNIDNGTYPNIEMSKAITSLAEICDERFWTETHIEQFTERLLTILDNVQLIKKDLVRDALLKIAQFFLSDQEFPRIEVSLYRDLYETLYLAFLSTSKELQYTGFFLLRLAEAQLRYASANCITIFHQLEQWCGVPIPRLEPWALDTFEMLLDYGLEPVVLASWYQFWVSELVRVQPRHQTTNLNGWLDLGRIIPHEDNLLEVLHERLSERAKIVDDPIKLLPEGYKIGIYSLLEPAAQRAREQILARNSNLEIRICTDKVLSEVAKSIAQNSDMVVMVITAMKHAVTYGVAPLIDPIKVVRPQSSGSTGLVRAVEEYAAKYFL